MTTTEAPRCEQCSAVLTGQAVGGLCANCLLKLALDPTADLAAIPDESRDAAADPAVPMEEAGVRIGHYKLLEQIGEGGFGVVWVADQLEPVRRRVALKIIKPGMDSREVIGRFEQERQALATMDHPNIAKVFDAGTTDKGRPYFVMELVRGVKITDYCDRENLPTADRLKLLITVCQAVQHAHQKGIIHRDLKPSNILVTPNDDGEPVPKVIDFGVAKAIQQQSLNDATVYTHFDQMIGTPTYMSPEQAGLGPMDIDTRSDVYALGVLLYELLTGRPPFDPKELLRAGLDEMRRVIREVEPPKPSTRVCSLTAEELSGTAARRHIDPPKLISIIRGDLDWIVMKALEKNRTRRYESATGLAADIQRHLVDQPVLARPPGAGYLLSRFVRRHKIGFAAGASVAVALLAGITAAVWGMWKAEAEVTRTRIANEANKQNLHLASMADFATAVKALEEDSAATDKGESALGFTGKSRWHEGVVLLTRALERDLQNSAAALRLYETLRSRQAEKRDWPLITLTHDEGKSFSPDGSMIVITSRDTVQVWDSSTGQAVSEPMRHESGVRSASFSPDGTRVVTICGSTVRVWEASTGKAVSQPMRHESYVKSARFSPNGMKIVSDSGASSGAGGYAQVWDALTGHVIGERIFHNGVVAGFSPDGARLAIVSDNTVRVWNAATGQAIGEPMLHTSHVNSVEFSPDGVRIVTASRGNTAQVWDTETGRGLGERLLLQEIVSSASFSPDGTRIVTAGGNTARLWDAATGQAIGQPLRHEGVEIFSASFSPDGTRVVTASRDNSVRVWDATTGQPIGLPLRHKGEGRGFGAYFRGEPRPFINDSRIIMEDDGSSFRPEGYWAWPISARFSADGARIVTKTKWDKTARVWAVPAGQVIGEPLRHQRQVIGEPFQGPVLSAKFSPDGTRIVTAGYDQTTQVWNTATGQAIGQPLRHEGPVFSASFSPDGTRIVTASGDKTARIWDAATGQAIGVPMRHNSVVTSAEFSPNGTRVVTASDDKTARIWNAETGQALGESLLHTVSLLSARFSPDGTKVLTEGYGAQLWDAATGHDLGHPMPHEDDDDDEGVWAPTFSPDGSRIVTASEYNAAQIWDAATGQAIGLPLRHEGVEIFSASFSPDGKRIVTAGDDLTTRVWDATTGQAIGQPLRHDESVYSASFSPDGTHIVTASWPKTARIWDAATGQPIGERMHHKYLVGASFSPDGARIVTLSDDGARLWNIVMKVESDAIGAMTPAILAWARNFSGLCFSEDGELHLIPDDERIAAVTTANLPPGPWADLAKWINTPAPQRTIDPKSISTLRQIAERERDFDGNGTLESLKSALRYDPTVPLARLFLAAALEKADAAKEAKDQDQSLPQRAAFLRRYDLDALSREAGGMKNDELAALWVRAANHLLGLPPETRIGVGPKPTTAREEAGKAARKALELVPGLPAAEEVLKKLQP